MKTMNEMYKLVTLLTEAHIPFEARPCWDSTIQVCYPNASEDMVCDAVCHNFSYGHEEGLLEIMGLVNEDVYDDVEGYLTAEEVFNRISRHYNKNKRKENPYG